MFKKSVRATPSGDEVVLGSLMRRSQSGDQDAYRRLLQLLQKLADRFAAGMYARAGLKETKEWEDAVQEILLAIHSKRHTYNREQNFLPWFYAIARYKVIDHLRARHRMPVTEDIAEVVIASDLSTESGVDGQDIEKLLATLPEKQRNILRLVKLEGLSVKETAEKLSLGESDVKVSLHRAMKSLMNGSGGEA